MRLAPAAALLALVAAPVLAQAPGSLPPPVPRPAEPAPAAAPDASLARQPALGERTGAAIDRAAESTGQVVERAAEGTGTALGRAMRWTGKQMQGAGEWTQRQGERLTGPQQPAAPPTAAPAPPTR